MMLRVLTVVCLLIASCYCAGDTELMIEETRAKKKKTTAKLLAMVLLFIFGKVAVFKVASVVIFMTIFQKLIALGGLMLNYYMRVDRPPTAPAQYGPPASGPAEYNTVGYSYGPPHGQQPPPHGPSPPTIAPPAPAPDADVFAGQQYGLPPASEPFNNWLFNKS